MKLGSGQFFGDILKCSEKCSEAAGVRMLVTQYSPGCVLPVHSHGYAYFCLIRSGNYEETYSSRKRLCTQGMVAFHPAAEDHRQRMGTETVVSFNVEMDASWTQRTMFREPWSASEGPLVWLANSLYREFQAADDLTPLAVEALLLEMAVASKRSTQELNPRWVSRARDILNQRFQERLTIRELARECQVHPAHFARAFRQCYRCSPGQYLRRLRVEAARHLLATSSDSGAIIAAACGFSDQSHLSRLFLRQFGVTPSAYRRLMS
jgi:AraC family transcriptional regulator